MNSGLEERIRAVYWGDGSLDLVAGLSVTGMGLAWQWGYFALSPICPALGLVLWSLLRKQLVEPRLGSVVFTEERRQQEREGLMLLVLAGGAALLMAGVGIWMMTGGGSPAVMSRISAGIPAFIIGTAGLLSGALLQLRRLAVYGILALVIGLAGALAGFEPWTLLVVSGLVPLAAGMVYLTRFLKEYPRRAEEEAGE